MVRHRAHSQAGRCEQQRVNFLSVDFGDNEVFAIEENSCTICLIEYQHGDEVQRNAFNEESKVCDHIFHPECITEWIEQSNNSECPCCRSPFAVLTKI
jgi:E3 ubiquitin-protein ligase DOA10